MAQNPGFQKPVANAFSNDGSFMEQFKRMQQQQQQESQQKQTMTTPEGSVKKPMSVSMKFGAVKKSTTPNLRTGVQRGSVKRAFGDDSDSEGEQGTQEDPAREKAPPMTTPPSYTHQSISTGSTQAMSSQVSASQAQLVGQKRKRASRFDAPPGASAGSGSSSKFKSGPGSKSGLSRDEIAIAEAMASFSDTSSGGLSAAQERQLQEQIEMKKMVAEIRAATQPKPKSMHNKGKKKEKYEYDSDEDIDEGGTWEHKKRAKEMEVTLDTANVLTERGRGKHHIADFLPPEELATFLETAQAVKEGRDPDLSDYRQHELTEENVGFKLLQKAGWKEGSGLGSKEDGIVKPINKGKTTFEQAGVGVEKPGEVSKEDDEFELYRKRMMLAYQFRPNPLNNPRRPYY